MKTLYVLATDDNFNDMVAVLDLTPENIASLANAEAAYEAASSTLRALQPEVKPYAVDVWFRVPVYDASLVSFPARSEDDVENDLMPWELSEDGVIEYGAEETSVNYVILSARESGFTLRLVAHRTDIEYSTEEVPWDFALSSDEGVS